MSLVLDTSVTIAWIYSDEITPPILSLLDRVGVAGAWVPGLWKLEVANVLEMGVRRGRHDPEFLTATIADLERLPIRVDPDTDRQAWGTTLRLASVHGLTTYDAAYLELALRRQLPLASLDQELRAAAKAEGVVVLGT